MKKKLRWAGRFVLGLAMAAAISFGSAEVVKGSGEVRSDCVDCHLEQNPDEFCSSPECCNAAGSICLGEPMGDCLCA